MAGGRRISRVLSPPSKHNNNFIYASAAVVEERLGPIIEMKHIRLPSLPRESILAFEIILLLHVGICTSLQFLHLYRTVWWLPQSFNSSGMNFYLMDGNIFIFILAILGRRIPYLLLKPFIPREGRRILQVVMSLHSIAWMAFAVFKLWKSMHPITHSLYLFGPLGLHWHVYGRNFSAWWEVEELDDPTFEGNVCKSAPGRHYFHICSRDPIFIREEVEVLRKEFNVRIQRILYQTTLMTYYSCFIPWCFVQPFVHYDLWWVVQHLVISWMLIFSLLVSRALCPDFSDALHKVSCHLGTWGKLRPAHIASNTWTGELLFHSGAIVKYQREFYKADGLFYVASEPGNTAHVRFHALFEGSSFARLLLGFHISLLILCIMILIRTMEWYQVISIGTLAVTSLYTFIRLGRDFMVVWRLYQTEETIIRQQQNS